MHGTIMVFLGIVPLAFAAFGNYVVPLMIGAPDMAFPRVNMASYQAYFLGGLVMFVSFFIPGGAAQAGWTSYSPLATTIPTHGQLVLDHRHGPAHHVVAAGRGQFHRHHHSTARAGHDLDAPAVLSSGRNSSPRSCCCWRFRRWKPRAIMQLMDNVAHTSFFLPTGLAVGGNLAHISGGGSPLLWQHLFWFLGHPEVYVLILPAMGIVCEIIANNTRKPIWGYKSLVYSVLTIGFLSFIVWAHHMYMTGMGTAISTFFQTTTMIISIPSVIILTCLFISLWGGSIRFNTPMLFALAFLPMFGIGGLTGLPLGFNVSDVHLHDTYYVIAHFHYVVAPGTIFGLFAGIYYWYPKMTGRMMNEFWGRVHFWCSLIFMNLVFMPMFAQGMAGMLRRMSDGGANYSAAVNSRAGADVIGGLSPFIMSLHTLDSVGAPSALGLAQIPFIINFFWSIKHGEKVGDNPWELHHARMADAHAAAAREFRACAARLSRPLRIQRARPCHRFHAAKRTGNARRRQKLSTTAH